MLDSLNWSKQSYSQYFSITSPYIAGLILKRTNSIYRPELTNSSDYFTNYSSSLKKSLNLGIYGADFAYLTLFNDQKRFSSYLKAMRSLGFELNLDEAIDNSILEQVESNIGKPDSILRLISLIYYDADVYLKKNLRNDVALLIITGGWIESMYLLCNEYKLTRNEQLYTFISCQKQTLDNLIVQLSVFFEKDQEMKKVTESLVDLAYEFDAISCNSQLTDSASHYDKGMIEIHNKTTIQNDNKSIKNIVNKVCELRQQIVQ